MTCSSIVPFTTKMMDDHSVFLALPPQAGVGLLVKFQAPVQAEPDDGTPSVLEVQAMSGGGGLRHGDWNSAFVPVGHVLRLFSIPARQQDDRGSTCQTVPESGQGRACR